MTRTTETQDTVSVGQSHMPSRATGRARGMKAARRRRDAPSRAGLCPPSWRGYAPPWRGCPSPPPSLPSHPSHPLLAGTSARRLSLPPQPHTRSIIRGSALTLLLGRHTPLELRAISTTYPWLSGGAGVRAECLREAARENAVGVAGRPGPGSNQTKTKPSVTRRESLGV